MRTVLIVLILIATTLALAADLNENTGVIVRTNAEFGGQCTGTSLGRIGIASDTGFKYRCVSGYWRREDSVQCATSPPVGRCDFNAFCVSKSENDLYFCDANKNWISLFGAGSTGTANAALGIDYDSDDTYEVYSNVGGVFIDNNDDGVYDQSAYSATEIGGSWHFDATSSVRFQNAFTVPVTGTSVLIDANTTLGPANNTLMFTRTVGANVAEYSFEGDTSGNLTLTRDADALGATFQIGNSTRNIFLDTVGAARTSNYLALQRRTGNPAALALSSLLYTKGSSPTEVFIEDDSSNVMQLTKAGRVIAGCIDADADGTCEVTSNGTTIGLDPDDSGVTDYSVTTSSLCADCVDGPEIAPTVTFSNGDYLDMSAVVITTSTDEGFRLPQGACGGATLATKTGQLCYSTTVGSMTVGTGTLALLPKGRSINSTASGLDEFSCPSVGSCEMRQNKTAASSFAWDSNYGYDTAFWAVSNGSNVARIGWCDDPSNPSTCLEMQPVAATDFSKGLCADLDWDNACDFNLMGAGIDVDVDQTADTPVESRWFPAGTCQATTAAPLWQSVDTAANLPVTCTAGTNTAIATYDFGDATARCAMIQVELPYNWTGAVDANLRWFGANITNSVVWTVSTACSDNSETIDPTFNTASSSTDAAQGTTNRMNEVAFTSISTTGCAAGELMFARVCRDAANASDTFVGNAKLIGMELKYRRTQLDK